MRALFLSAAIALLFAATPAMAYRLQRAVGSGDCLADGSACNVFCNNGILAGTMFWNGSVWTDGVKSDPDREAEARSICAANGTDCT